MNFSTPSFVLPIVSILSLLLYFLTYDFFLNQTIKYFRDFIFFVACFSDLGYRLTNRETDKPFFRTPTIISFLSSGAFLLFMIRNFLDVPTKAGVSKELSSIPKIRDFLLVLIILSTIFALIFQLLIIVSKQSEQAQTNLGLAKRSLLQNTMINLFTIAPILIAVNYFSSLKNYNFDLSSINKFSYTETSRAIIKEMNKELEVVAFFPRPLESSDKEESWVLTVLRPDIEIYLDQLKAINPRIKVQFINADVERDLLSNYPQATNGMILFRTLKSGNDLMGKPFLEEKIFVQSKKDLEELERKIIQAINNISISKKKIYFSSNYGEHYGTNFESQLNLRIDKFISTLNFFNYQIEELNYKNGFPEKIPDDADLVIFIGPQIEIPEVGRQTIKDYIFNKKGKIFITIDPDGKEHFNWLLKDSKLEFINESLRQMENRPEIIANNFPEHPISRLFTQKQVGVVHTNTGYFEKRMNRQDSIYDETLILDTGFNTFVDENKNGKMDKDEFLKNYTIGAILVPKDQKDTSGEEGFGKILIFSGTDWITNKLYLFNLNPVMAGNSINWLFQKPIIENILPKKEEIPTVTLTQTQKLIIWSLGMFGYPISIISLLSIYVYNRRKKKK
jgi:hypothetical protein